MCKRWTEAQAWRYLAERWDRPRHHKSRQQDVWLALVFRRLQTGLCWSVRELATAGAITMDTKSSMQFRMLTHEPKHVGPYWCPRTIAGARRRAAFCRRMARLAAREETPHEE